MCEPLLPVYEVSGSKSKNKSFPYPRREQK